MNPYLTLSIAAVLPVLAAGVIYKLDSLSRLPYKARQVIIGVVFGLFAVLGTEWGIPINGAQANVRDASVIIAGLFFGAPAGLVAGTIGAVERWFSVYWGIGEFTRVACTVSTFIAGVYSAVLRKTMFEDKRPGWLISYCIGTVMEVFHLTMVFITNTSTPSKAIEVVAACTAPMVIANGASVLLAGMLITLLSKEKLVRQQDKVNLSQTIQRWLLVVVLFAFTTTTYLVFRLQNSAFLSHMDTGEIRDMVLYVNTFLEILVFAMVFGLTYLLIRKVIVEKLDKVNDNLGQIIKGDLSQVVDVRSNQEFASLSDYINNTVDTLKNLISEAEARIDRELEFAASIQSSALPGIFPAFPRRKEIDIYATMDPAKEVGGDFYDFYITDNDRLNFLIADVSGKGIPAAMFMMRAKTELKSLTEADLPLEEVFTIGNRALCEGNDAGMFVTCWQGSMDFTNGKLSYVNAGHNPPLVRHSDGKFEYLKGRSGFVLAGMDGVNYRSQTLDLAPGDIVFLYTDGITEANNREGELYGEDRLLELLNHAEFTDMTSLCKVVEKDVSLFVGDTPQFDDMTMLAFRYQGNTMKLLDATCDDLGKVTAFIDERLESVGCSAKAMTQINIAVDEVFSNIINYGYEDKRGPVRVSFASDGNEACITIKDRGVKYNPLEKGDPDVTLSASEREIGGLGIFLVRKMMDKVEYCYEDGCNILAMTKSLS